MSKLSIISSTALRSSIGSEKKVTFDVSPAPTTVLVSLVCGEGSINGGKPEICTFLPLGLFWNTLQITQSFCEKETRIN